MFCFSVFCLSEERVVLLFVSDGGRRAVSRIYPCCLGEGEQLGTDALAKLVEVASLQICPSDASVEEHVAGKKTGGFLAMEDVAARRMSRHMKRLQTDVAESDDVALADVSSQSRLFLFVEESETTCHGRCLVEPELVLLTALGTQPVFLEEERIAEDVVQMEVCTEHMFQRESVVRKIVFQHLLFLWVEASWVDDYGFARIVGEDVAVHGEHIEFEFLYFHNCIFLHFVIQTTGGRKNLGGIHLCVLEILRRFAPLDDN